MKSNNILQRAWILVWCLVCLPRLAVGQQPGSAILPELGDEPGIAVPAVVGPESEAVRKPAGWDPAVLSAGEAAFQGHCLSCHDANRSLDKKKGLGSWRATVQRMATKDGADIPGNTWESISVYLTAKDQPAGPAGVGNAAGNSSAGDEDPLSVFATLSPLWRGGNANLQNPGFFPEVWVGAAWQSSGSPVSGRVTACVSCHNEPGLGSRIELVEAVLRLDLSKWLNNGCEPCERALQLAVEAGRIIVPFGAFSSQVNPGVYRTVSRPLIFNMGQRVFDANLGDPVLPMPYSDEGLNLSASRDVWNGIVVTGDFYVVNGLQGGDGGINFDMSREYVDNNKTPAVGARGTIGNQALKIGGSIMGGRFNDNLGAGLVGQGLYYWIYGADATFRHADILRLQFEYAQRDTDTFVNLPGQLLSLDRVGGSYVEGELLVSRKYKLSLLSRFDTQSRHSLTPLGGMPTGSFNVSRFTYGVNHVLPGGSLLMLNVEHWFLPNPLQDIDVLGVRWAATF